MRVPSVRTIRRLLPAFVGVVALAVLGNFLLVFLRRPPADVAAPPLLDAEVKHAAAGVEIFIRNGSALRFAIQASRLRETTAGRNFLEGITASDFNADGSVRNVIHSENAVYDPVGKFIDFAGDVRMRLQGDVELRAAALRYDLDREIGVIAGNMTLRAKNLRGQARNVRFERAAQRLELGEAVEFTLPQAPGAAIVATAAASSPESSPALSPESSPAPDAAPGAAPAIRATAGRAACLLAENRIFFTGGVRMENADAGRLVAATVTLRLDAGRSRITDMEAAGSVTYSEPPGVSDVTPNHTASRFLSGDSLSFTAGEPIMTEQIITVRGRAGQGGQALLRLTAVAPDAPDAPEWRELRAATLRLRRAARGGAVRVIQGRGNATLRASENGVAILAAGAALDAEFAVGGRGSLSRLRLENTEAGAARIALTDASGVNELRAEVIQADFTAAGATTELAGITASGAARWDFTPDSAVVRTDVVAAAPGALPPSRRLAAATLRLRYSGRYPQTGQAVGQVELVESAPAQTSVLSAGQIDFSFFPAATALRRLTARGDVHTFYQPATAATAERYETFSDELAADFTPARGTGALLGATQRGHFRFLAGERSGRAERADYDAGSRRLTLTGYRAGYRENGTWSGVEIVAPGQQLRARRVVYDVAARELQARGDVRAVISGADRGALLAVATDAAAGETSAAPVVVTAAELRYLAPPKGVAAAAVAGRLHFTGDVRVLSASQQLRAESIDLGADGQLTASGKVSHHIARLDADGGRPADIGAGRLEFRQGGAIRYSDKVTVKAKGLELIADTVEGQIAEKGSGLGGIRAVGRALLRYGGRVCRGETVTWDRATESYVVTGNPVVIDDPLRGRSLARRLTLAQAEDRITLEP